MDNLSSVNFSGYLWVKNKNALDQLILSDYDSEHKKIAYRTTESPC